MQLTKLRAAPVRQAEVPPCAPAGKTHGGTASQLIRGVRRTGPSRRYTSSGWVAVHRLTSYGLTATESGRAFADYGSPATDRRLRIAGLGGEARLDRLRMAAMCSVGIAGGALVRGHRCSVATERPRQTGVTTRPPPNKGMKLTKLSAAWLAEWTCRLMPAPTRSDAGTASQLIPGVMRTLEGAQEQGWLNEQTAS
jgi:hypothetical protein